MDRFSTGAQQTIAHYRITAKLGEGGMGEVWRATDTKLGRDVAIKVLPESFSQDSDRMARFEREAKVLAAPQYRLDLRNRRARAGDGAGRGGNAERAGVGRDSAGL